MTKSKTLLCSCSPLLDANIKTVVLLYVTDCNSGSHCNYIIVVVYYLKVATFKVVSHHYPLTRTHNPCRNLYTPPYSLRATALKNPVSRVAPLKIPPNFLKKVWQKLLWKICIRKFWAYVLLFSFQSTLDNFTEYDSTSFSA